MAAGVLTEERPVGTLAQTTLPFTSHFTALCQVPLFTPPSLNLPFQHFPPSTDQALETVRVHLGCDTLDFSLLAFSLNFWEHVESLESSEKQEGLSR